MRMTVKTLFRKCWHYLPFASFVVAAVCLIFAYGVAVGRWQLCPYGFFENMWRGAKKSAAKLYEDITKRSLVKPHFLSPARYERQGVVTHSPGESAPGVTLLTGPWENATDWNPGIRLIDSEGSVLHEWQCDPREIWAESPHKDYATGQFDHKLETIVHGAVLLPNGDVVFNLEYLGLVRLNSRSEVVWKLPYRTHHSLYVDGEGDYWVCGRKYHDEHIPEYVGLEPKFSEDMIVEVSSNGRVKREISVLKAIYRSGYDGLLRQTTEDVLHMNDVEVLDKDKAGAFTNVFNVGDILVSLHTINSILVIDGSTELVKWSLTHPFIGQHDPDFTDDGYITVFDNHSEFWGDKQKEQGSRIVQIEPSTKKVETLYGWTKEQYFYSRIGGKHQHLPNGNMLIVETVPGRVFEINPKGETVWEWIVERWYQDEDSVPEIMQGTRYNESFARFATAIGKDEE